MGGKGRRGSDEINLSVLVGNCRCSVFDHSRGRIGGVRLALRTGRSAVLASDFRLLDLQAPDLLAGGVDVVGVGICGGHGREGSSGMTELVVGPVESVQIGLKIHHALHVVDHGHAASLCDEDGRGELDPGCHARLEGAEGPEELGGGGDGAVGGEVFALLGQYPIQHLTGDYLPGNST